MKKTWTGERLETHVYSQNTIEHLHRYAIASSLTSSKVVLDIACGEGYGTNLLSKNAKQAIGVDISKETIQSAKCKYQGSNITFIEGSADNIPCDSGSIDVVVSFETIEHHDKHQEMMKEIKRVLNPGGILLMSSPDKYYYSELPNYNNPFHVKELYENEFKSLINDYFKNTIFAPQVAGYLSVILPEKKVPRVSSYRGSYTSTVENTNWGPTYWLAFASDNSLDYVNFHSFFTGDKIIKHEINQIHQLYKGSITYKIGNTVLNPIRKLKDLFSKK